ncbi:MAG: copper resistance CopC/CopD family protein [Desertimonas sp.]
MRRLLAGVALAVVTVGAAPAGPVAAHAVLIGTEPPDGAVVATTPDVAVLEFNETVSLTGGSVRVIGRAGNDVALNVTQSGPEVTIDLPDELPEGTYTIAYQVISADSHQVSGATTFSVGFADETAPAAPTVDDVGSVLRTGRSILLGLAYLGVLLAVGTWWAVSHVFGPRCAPEPLDATIRGAAAVGLAALAVGLPVRIAVIGGTDTLRDWSAFEALLDGPVGHASLVSFVALALFAIGVGRRWRPSAVSVLGLVAVVGFALEGHSRAESPAVVAMSSDAVHLVAGAIWLGGLTVLTVLWRRSAPAAHLTAMVRRFSTAAAICVAAVTATGLVLGVMILPELSALWRTGYGRTLLIKVGLVAVVAGVGGLNRYVLLPRLRDGDRGRRSLFRLVGTETLLLVAVVIVAGFLVDQSPVQASSRGDRTGAGEQAGQVPATTWPAVATTPAVTVELSGGAGQVAISGLPAGTGGASVVIALADPAGAPLEAVEPPLVSIRSEELDVGPLSWDVHELGGGNYHLYGAVPSIGTWTLTVRVRIDDFTSSTASTDFTVAG